MHAKLVSICLACQSVFVKVMPHGVDLVLHAKVRFRVTLGTNYCFSTQLCVRL